MGSSIVAKKVCGKSVRSFCSGILRSISPRMPLQIVQTEEDGKEMVFKLQRVWEKTSVGEELKLGLSSRIVGLSHGWVCAVDVNEQRKMSMYNPVNIGAKLYNPVNTGASMYNPVNVGASLYNPVSGCRIELPPIPHSLIYTYSRYGGPKYTCVRRMILSCSPEQGQQECGAIVSVGNCLAFCWPLSSPEWTGFLSASRDYGMNYYKDFAYMKALKLVVCLGVVKTRFDRRDESSLQVWDVADVASPRQDWLVKNYHNVLPFDGRHKTYFYFNSNWTMIKEHSYKIHYLVASPLQQSELFHVVRYVNYWTQTTIDFDVYKIVLDGGEERGRWSECNVDLDGLVMFVGGYSESVAVEASSYGFPPPNSICFTDGSNGGRDNGIFNYKKRDFLPGYYPADFVTITMPGVYVV